MSRFVGLRMPLILLVLALSVAAPAVIAGYGNLLHAQRAAAEQQYSVAAGYYEAAARELPWQTGLWERAGLLAYANTDFEDCARLLRVALQRGSLSAHGWDVLGSALWAQGDHDSAVSAWKAGSLGNPGDVELLDRLASAYHQQGDFAAEESALTQRLALAEDAYARYHLGLLQMVSDPPAARKDLLAAAKNSQFAPATATLIAALDAASLDADPAAASILVGRGLGLVNEWTLALKAFERATQVDAKNADAWAWLGEARQHTGGGGRPELDRALSLDSRDSLVRVLRGLYWKRQGDNAQALTEYLAAAQLEPGNPSLQTSLGDAYAASGDLVAALRAYQNATQLAPTDPTYWRLLALFCADNGVQAVEIGVPAAQKAAALAPSDPQVLDALGWSYAQAGFANTAEQTLLKAIRGSPDLVLAHLHLAEVYLRQGNKPSAFDELHMVVKLDPSGPAGQAAAQLLSRYFP